MTNLFARNPVLDFDIQQGFNSFLNLQLDDFIPNNGVVVEESLFASLYPALKEKMEHTIWAVRHQVRLNRVH